VNTVGDKKWFLCIYANFVVCFWRDSPPVGQGLLIYEVSRLHTTYHSQ